jgi:hypothetical protein
VWNTAVGMGFGKYFLMKETESLVDDHYFVNKYAKIPSIDIVNYDHAREGSGFAAHWHTLDDNLEIIDREVLNAVGQTLSTIIYFE